MKQQHTCVATSSGNTGAALAAYCAAADLRCRIAVLETTPVNKLQQMLVYGAEVFRVRGFGMDPECTARVLDLVTRLGSSPGHAHQISAYAFSPVGMGGVESISRELADQLPETGHVFSPGGGGGLTLAVARGYRDRKSPAIHVVQPEGNDTMAGPLREGANRAREVSCSTQISGLQVASVIDGHEVIAACRSTGGNGHLVTDEASWNVQARLAREEGIFCEPAGAVALAGALQAAAHGEIEKDTGVVCLVTGSGFKVIESLEKMTEDSPCPTITVDDLEHEVTALS